MITLNERNVGTHATRLEVDTVISFLGQRGYSVEYGPYTPGAAQSIKRSHWNAAQRAACKAAVKAPTLRRMQDLSTGERVETLANINAYLTELLCSDLFSEVNWNSAPTLEAAAVVAEAEAILK